MTFRSLNQRFLAPAAQSLMIFGIIALCQPWNLFLHKYGVTLTLVGLIAFLVTSKIKPDPEQEVGLIEDSLDELELEEEPDGPHENESYKDGGIV
jgi:hypothetical protein